MGLLNIFFRKPKKYSPDFNKTEYDNWLDFLSEGGTSVEWKDLLSKNSWKFKEDDTESFLRYEKEFRPIFNKYLASVESIEKRWTTLYASKDYNSRLSDNIEKECYTAIDYYEKVRRIDLKYGQAPLKGSKAFTKLALLYERREDYEKAISVCKKALTLEIDERKRLERMIKKSGRTPSQEELKLLN